MLSGVRLVEARQDRGTRVPRRPKGPSGRAAVEAVVLSQEEGNDREDQSHQEQSQVMQDQSLSDRKVSGQPDQEREGRIGDQPLTIGDGAARPDWRPLHAIDVVIEDS